MRVLKIRDGSRGKDILPEPSVHCIIDSLFNELQSERNNDCLKRLEKKGRKDKERKERRKRLKKIFKKITFVRVFSIS